MAELNEAESTKDTKKTKKEKKMEEKAAKKAAKKAKKNHEADKPDAENDDSDSVSSKIVMVLVTILIIAIWLGIFAVFVKADVGGFGSTVLAPALKDVPVLSKILPDSGNITASESTDLSDNSTSYKSSFSDKLTDSMWEITMPVDSGRVVLFQLGTQFDFIIYTQNKTILKSSAIVRQRYRKENMYFLAIELINNLEKIQRRQFFRLPCTIDMDFYEVRYDDKAESELEFCKKMYKNHAINSKNMNTVKSVILDISGGGIRFSLSTPLEEGTYFMAQFSLALEECTQQFNIVCKVINCTQSLDYADRYFARSKFIFDRMTEREKIVRFVFEEERRIRRREME